MAVCLSDTSCLIHLERIEQLDVLRALYDDIRIPPAARDEFGRVPDGIDVAPTPNVALIR
jgi:predicted nucleic acid-binding protein